MPEEKEPRKKYTVRIRPADVVYLGPAGLIGAPLPTERILRRTVVEPDPPHITENLVFEQYEETCPDGSVKTAIRILWEDPAETANSSIKPLRVKRHRKEDGNYEYTFSTLGADLDEKDEDSGYTFRSSAFRED